LNLIEKKNQSPNYDFKYWFRVLILIAILNA